jgi:caffeoyl-CoA O-methyltransferase
MLTLTKPEIDQYAILKSEPVPALLEALERETNASVPMAIMLCGALEGRLLKLLVQLAGSKRVLEIGMFTGYSALSMAEALPPDGELVTCEIDPKTIAVAKKYFAQSEHGKKITVMEGPALESVKQLSGSFDFVFIDADKVNYPHYYEAVLPLVRAGGLIVLDNVLYGGEVLNPLTENPTAIAKLNDKIAGDQRVTCVMLPIRDGISVVRKR